MLIMWVFRLDSLGTSVNIAP